MKTLSLALSMVVVGVAGLGCQTNPLVIDSDGGADLSHASSSVPLWHRATAAACAADRPASNCTNSSPDLGGDPNACHGDSSCTAGSNGRCTGSRGGCMCTYDACSSDADCGAGNLCNCRGTLGDRPSGVTKCVASNCRVDADCGASGYCSPSLDPGCGSYIGVTEWHCHTPADSCVNDTDCQATPTSLKPFCGFDPAIGHWSCLSTTCVG